jgi:hypothetical protein
MKASPVIAPETPCRGAGGPGAQIPVAATLPEDRADRPRSLAGVRRRGAGEGRTGRSPARIRADDVEEREAGMGRCNEKHSRGRAAAVETHGGPAAKPGTAA